MVSDGVRELELARANTPVAAQALASVLQAASLVSFLESLCVRVSPRNHRPIMPSVDELAADDPYDVEGVSATRYAAKKMTSNQLRDRLTAAAADASGLKPALVEKWVATAREVAVAKKTKRVTGEDVARAIGWRRARGLRRLGRAGGARGVEPRGPRGGQRARRRPGVVAGLRVRASRLRGRPVGRLAKGPVSDAHSCWPLAARLVSGGADRRLELANAKRVAREDPGEDDQGSDSEESRFVDPVERVCRNLDALARVAVVGEAAAPVGVSCCGDVGSLLPRLWVPALDQALELPLEPAALRAFVAKVGRRAPLGKGIKTASTRDARRTWRFGLGTDVPRDGAGLDVGVFVVGRRPVGDPRRDQARRDAGPPPRPRTVLYATLTRRSARTAARTRATTISTTTRCYMLRPPLRVELIKIRDFVPREAPKFWVGD